MAHVAAIKSPWNPTTQKAAASRAATAGAPYEHEIYTYKSAPQPYTIAVIQKPKASPIG